MRGTISHELAVEHAENTMINTMRYRIKAHDALESDFDKDSQDDQVENKRQKDPAKKGKR